MRKAYSRDRPKREINPPLKTSLSRPRQTSSIKRSVQKELHQKIFAHQIVTASRERQRSRLAYKNNSTNKSAVAKQSRLNQDKSVKKKNDQTTMTEPNDHLLRSQFDEAVGKVFSILDIFSRGTISQTNINKWVPEAALYFLGSVFQSIRNKRNVLTRQEFHTECLKLFRMSTDADIREFINNIISFQNSHEQKQSIDDGNGGSHQKEKTIQSRVEDRYSFPEDGETSFRNLHIDPKSSIFVGGQNTIPARMKIGTESHFDKIVIEGKSQKINDENISGTKSNQGTEIKRLRKNNLMEWNRGQKQIPEPLKDIGQYENVAYSIVPKKAPILPNYSYSPPKMLTNPKSSAISYNVSHPKKAGMGQSCVKAGGDYDKIDELSLRLEKFIQQNAARLQRSKNTRIQL